MKLSGRTVLITGGTGGIGLGLAEAFYRAKSTVIICGRDEQKLTEAQNNYPGLKALRCDVGDPAQLEKLAEEVLSRFPAFDTLINNAGIQYYADLKMGYDGIMNIRNEITTNFISVVELTALFISHLMRKPSAAIINVGSGLAFMPMLRTPIYSATKAALHTYTLVLRHQLKDSGIKVIEIIPPMVDTGLNREGRDQAGLKFRGISTGEYIPTVVTALEKDEDMIFYGEGARAMSQPRGESETRLLSH